MNFTLICACNDPRILNENLLASPFAHHCQVLIQYGYTNVPLAYNEAMPAATGDILIFAHQDVYMPDSFEGELRQSLLCLGRTDWGVLGPAGQSASGGYGYVLDRGQPWGKHRNLPIEVDTLDELLLIVKRGDYQFDQAMPNHHLIGADLCMQARARQQSRWAIRAYCSHNSKTSYGPPEPTFWLAADYLMRKWPQFLPIYTTVADLRGIDAPRIARP